MSELLIDALARVLRTHATTVSGGVISGDCPGCAEAVEVLARYDKWKSGAIEMRAPAKPEKKLEVTDNRCPHCGTLNPPFGVATLQIIETGAMLAVFFCGRDDCRAIHGVQMIRMPRGLVELSGQMPGDRA
jgi:hypothetical protein